MEKSETTRALEYHQFPTPGKVAVVSTKPCETAIDLSLAYSPGVAAPCLAIAEDRSLAYNYTSKGNLVAVISNGTAVLGLGNIGAQASKPVMEGKGVLFKTFADIDVFDIELDCVDVDHFVNTVAALAPTFGGINLEDIKAPECFVIEERLKEQLDIPVFHDDQHGTAIIAAAALLNALEITGRNIADIRLVISGAGAAAVASARLLIELGLRRENILMVDSVGVIYKGRSEGINKFKEEFLRDTPARTLADAMEGADVFFGLSAKDLVSPKMLLSMADNPIVFAMANPDPEIDYNLAKKTRPDVIMATGRSDFPNQVNNVLGFPFIFRGALDVRARSINEEMKMAAVKSLAALAKEPVPDGVKAAYGKAHFSFGPDYLIPKPFDPRVLYYVAPAVARAAIESGVARQELDLDEYTITLKGKQNQARSILRGSYGLARRSNRKRIAFPEGSNPKVLSAAIMARDEGIAEPVLFGRRKEVEEQARLLELDVSGIEMIEPAEHPDFERYCGEYYQARKRKGITPHQARLRMAQGHIYANMMLAAGEVYGLICGVDQNYPEMVRPILEIVGLKKGYQTAAGMCILSAHGRLFFLADTTVNLEMSSVKLANIAVMAADFVESMKITPRVAMLSFSNFGSLRHPSAAMVQQAVGIAKDLRPTLQIDGEMQADTATVPRLLEEDYGFTELKKPANILIFPDMQSGNIAYKLLQRVGGALAVGPIILGLNAPAYVMQRHATSDEVFNMITVAAAEASLSSVFPPEKR